MTTLDIRDRKGAVYICRNSDGAVIYVGQTSHWGNRRSHHRGNTAWWNEVADVEVIWTSRKADRLAVERQLIEQHQPRHNTEHTPRKRNYWDSVRLPA